MKSRQGLSPPAGRRTLDGILHALSESARRDIVVQAVAVAESVRVGRASVTTQHMNSITAEPMRQA